MLLKQSKTFVGRKMKAKQANETATSESLLISNKYQPRHFQQIAGQNIVVKTLSNAVHKKKIAPLYLFHGPNGTGKTSTARVFAMAINCESNDHKPCCSCSGCSRSLYTTELCSGNRTSGFETIKTLLQNTSFAKNVPGFKLVVVIEECHLVSLEAWDEVMSLSDAANLVFVLVTHVDISAIPAYILSRCQKFHFTKIDDDDVTERVARIIADEGMVIEKEALELIVAKSQGSLRDAENILDQLALLGPTIDTSAVKQLVGLVPQSELLDLLAMAVSGDTINMIRNAKKLMRECVVEPASFVSQLVYLITELLSEDLSSSPHANLPSKERLCYILKLLVNTQSPSVATIIEAFLDISSVKASSINITTEHVSDAKKGSFSDMERLWTDVLNRMQSSRAQKFLCCHAKLASLSISNTNATIHLSFARQEDKMAAEISQQSLAKALGDSIGCPVTLHTSLNEPSDAITNTNKNKCGESSSQISRLTKSKSCSTSRDPQTTSLIQGVDSRHAAKHRWMSLSSIPHSDASVEPYSQDVIYANLTQATQSMKVSNEPMRHRRRSSSSVSNVEPYSRDVTYANVNNGALRNKGLSRSMRFQEPVDQLQTNPAWCC